jgi:hypothetical protein
VVGGSFSACSAGLLVRARRGKQPARALQRPGACLKIVGCVIGIMKPRHFATVAVTAVSLALSVASPAEAEDTVKVKTGKGLDACPATNFCLYEHGNYNGSGPAKVWLFHTSNAYSEFSLKGRDAADKGRSAYNHTGKTSVISDQWTLGGSKGFVQMRAGAKLPSLNGLGPNEGAGVYVTSQNTMVGHTYHDAKYAKSLDLNDHARAIKIGGQPPLGADQPAGSDASTIQAPDASLIGAISGPADGPGPAGSSGLSPASPTRP